MIISGILMILNSIITNRLQIIWVTGGISCGKSSFMNSVKKNLDV